jgi:tetratricopeptide (TPR) repeat protein
MNCEPTHQASGTISCQPENAHALETSLIGREVELNRLERALKMATEKRELQMITVFGEAGIGKSRLMQEFLRKVQGPPFQSLVLWGAAEEEMRARPFSLIRDVFCRNFQILDTDPAAVAWEKFLSGFNQLFGQDRPELSFQADCIGQLLGFEFPKSATAPVPKQTRYELFEMAGQLFASLEPGTGSAGGVPHKGQAILLVLEDAHWGDEDSLDLVAHLSRSCHGRPWLVFCLARPEFSYRRPGWGEEVAGYERLDLGPLTTRETQLLVQRRLGNELHASAGLCEPILAVSGGNPFYIEETINVLNANRIIVSEAGQWRIDLERLAHAKIPTSAAKIVNQRLEALSATQRELLQAASVIGHVFWDNAVERLMERAPQSWRDPGRAHAVSSTLVSLCEMEIVQRRAGSDLADAAEYAFRHELLRSACYASLAREMQARYHAEAAEWLVERSGGRLNEFSGLVAVHFERAGRGAQAAHWYGQAGQQARAAYAPAAAIDYFEKALGLEAAACERPTRQRGEALGWMLDRGDALTIQGRFGEALATYEKLQNLAQEAGEVAIQVRAWNAVAFLRERLGDSRASIEAAEHAEDLARRAGAACRGELIRALQLKGWAFYRLSDAQQVLALADETLKLCERGGDRANMAISFKLFGVACLQLGRYQEADRSFAQGLTLCQELGDQRNTGAMFSNLGESARLRGEHAAAVPLYQQALAIARKIGERTSEMIYLSNLAGARLGLGQFGQAEIELRQAIALTGVSKSCSLAETFSFLASACLGQGKLKEAFQAARQAVTIAQQSENVWDLAGGWRVLGEVTLSMQSSDAFVPAETRTPAECFAESARLYQSIGAEAERLRTLEASTA